VKIGVLGGTGLYDMQGLKKIKEHEVDTPFGKPSSKILEAELHEETVFFLPRHGKGHLFSPSKVNYRANIFAMKLLGVEKIISVSAVGSMKEGISPGDVVIVDQFFDRTVTRPRTFFDDGIVAHVSFADPVCPKLAGVLADSARKAGATMHEGGTYVCIEGPQFSTRAESQFFRSLGVDVIGMTNLPEARLAREAEICYATLAMVTDYDCWHESEEDVSVEAVIKILKQNAELAQKIVTLAASSLEDINEGSVGCECNSALKNAIITDKRVVSKDTKKRLAPLIGKYMED